MLVLLNLIINATHIKKLYMSHRHYVDDVLDLLKRSSPISHSHFLAAIPPQNIFICKYVVVIFFIGTSAFNPDPFYVTTDT